jgi:tetratricopeptide (TPR) repeat protein
LEQGLYDESRKSFRSGRESIREHQSEFVPAQLSYLLYTPERIPTLMAAYTFAIGLADVQAGELEAARTGLEEMGSLLPHYSEILHAELLLAEGSYEKAITVCEKCRHADIPYMSDTDGMLAYNLPPLKDAEARACVMKGDLERAINQYETLSRFEPESRNRRLIHPKYHYRLAGVYEKTGRNGDAIAEYEKFLRIMESPGASLKEIDVARKKITELK